MQWKVEENGKFKAVRTHLQCGRSDLGRSPGEGNGYPLQYSGRENSMDCSPWGHEESDTTERLPLSTFTWIQWSLTTKVHSRLYQSKWTKYRQFQSENWNLQTFPWIWREGEPRVEGMPKYSLGNISIGSQTTEHLLKSRTNTMMHKL